MGRIQQCVKDVLYIANHSESSDQAKKRIEQLLAESKAQHRGHLAVVQRVRDQLYRAYNDAPADAQVCLDRVLDWLDREHLSRCRHGD